MKKKIAFIGASGFVGTRLLNVSVSNFDIINLDKQQSTFYPELTVLGDIRDQDFLDKFLAGRESVVLLAAEHRDDVSPTSLYYDVNVEGTQNVLNAMEKNNISNIIFTSSVAVYGLNKNNPNEHSSIDPFNHYGKSKWQAEELLKQWYYINPSERSLTIIRPTVIFGERNRGNVYNLLKQISSGKFIMVGNGNNYKSMAYVENIVEFIKYKLENIQQDFQTFNYIDKPDLNMNQLLSEVEMTLNKKIPSIHLPYILGMLGGLFFDLASKITGKKFTISAVRVKKFCATTQFDTTELSKTDFQAPYTLSEGLNRTLTYEFLSPKKDNITFKSE